MCTHNPNLWSIFNYLECSYGWVKLIILFLRTRKYYRFYNMAAGKFENFFKKVKFFEKSRMFLKKIECFCVWVKPGNVFPIWWLGNSKKFIKIVIFFRLFFWVTISLYQVKKTCVNKLKKQNCPFSKILNIFGFL